MWGKAQSQIVKNSCQAKLIGIITGWWFQPSEKYWLGSLFPIYGEKNMFESTNQIRSGWKSKTHEPATWGLPQPTNMGIHGAGLSSVILPREFSLLLSTFPSAVDIWLVVLTILKKMSMGRMTSHFDLGMDQYLLIPSLGGYSHP